MWEYNHTDELYHGKHKYIAKIGEGVKARYFYTQEALEAYKKALSSKDEKAAYLDPNNPVNQFHGGVVSTPEDKQKWEEESAKRDAERARLKEDYDKAKTLKGKAEAVGKVFDERHEGAAAYKKALSSKDEKAKLDKALEGPGVTKRDITDARTGRVIGTATTIQGKENIDRVMKAEGEYAEASSLKGKAKAVSKVFNERNPETAKKLKRGKDFVAGLFR